MSKMRQSPSASASRHSSASLRTAVIILAWYSISATIILTTKWVFSKPMWGDQKLLFPFPLLLTTCSNTLATFWALLLSRHSHFAAPPPSAHDLRRYVLPIGAVTALDLGCSNVALKLLDVSFGTIIKGAAPVFTMMWGLAFGIEYFSPRVLLSLVAISGGVALATFGEGSHFLLGGFLLQLFATALAGLRWALTQILLKGRGVSMPPIAVILYTSPATALCLLPVALLREGPRALEHVHMLPPHERALLAGLLTAIGTLVFVLLMSEYWLVEFTSSLALSVCAVFKELLTIFGGVVLYHERLSALNIVGFVVCQSGIGAYVAFRSKRDNSNAQPDGDVDELQLPLTMNDDPWDESLSPMPRRTDERG